MSQNIQQIFVANPASSMVSTDLYYLGRSPYGATNDMAITWANVMSSITVVGTIVTGVWQGTQIGVIYGGTGLTSTTANQLLYSSSNNVIAGLATANSGTLITSAGGVPSISSTLPTAVQGNITQLGAQSQALNMNSHLINNVTDPVNPQDAATKFYVDQTALNGTSVYAASAGSLGTVTQSGAGVGATLTNAGVQATFALDGVNPPVGSNVLIKNTATGMTAANEGIYTVTNVGSGATNWVLTRATSFDTATEINNTGLIVVQNGSTLIGTAWYNAATIVTVDTTAFSFSEFGNIVFPISLAHGGTNANLTASNGGIFYSTASAGAILAGTSTAGQVLTSGASTTPAWTTTTYPLTNAINTIMYASSANVLGVITPVNSAVLTSSAGGVPSWNTSLPAGTGINVTMAVKKGSGTATDYTTSSASYVDVDGTNLAYTVTVPTGYKIHIVANMTAYNTTVNDGVIVAITDGTTVLAENENVSDNSTTPQSKSLGVNAIFTGDGASHTFLLRFKVDGGGTAHIFNGSATFSPQMTFLMMPSS